MIDYISIGFNVMVVAITMNIVVASYGIFARPSIVKKILSLVIFSDSLNVLAVAIGFRMPKHGYPSPPILVEEPNNTTDIEIFADMSVDPLPQAFVITAIVIDLAIVVFLLSLTIAYHRYFGSTNISISFEEKDNEEII